MSNQIKDIDRLGDISNFCSLIIEKGSRLSWEKFDEDEILKWAFVKCLESIGEAAYQLSDETVDEFDEVDWRSIINARHMYIHHYYNLAWPRVWKTLTEIDFASLKISADKIKEILKARF